MDTELVQRAQRGDSDAFSAVTDRLAERMRRVAFGILRDVHLAEDATQQAALDMWRDLPRLRDVSRFEAWSYRVLVRACYAEARRARRWRIGVLPTREPVARDEYRPVVDRDELERAFARLSEEQRAVVVLRHYIGMPLDAIAEALGIPEGTVSSRLHRAMKSLRAAMEADARPGQLQVSPQEVTS